jgi:hypothetical protein
MIQRGSEGDEAAWRQIVALYQPLTRAWLVAQHIQPQDAEGLTQDVLAVLLRSGRHGEAVARLEQAVRLSADGKGGATEWMWLALAHAEKRRVEEARRCLDRAALPRPDGAEVWDVVLLELLAAVVRRALGEGW